MAETQNYVFHCPSCNEPIGSIRPYTGRKAGRPTGARDGMPRSPRAGDLNKAVTTALMADAKG